MTANPKVDWYFNKPSKWQKEVSKLREISLECGLNEALTYGKPTYYIVDHKLFLIHTFKDYAAILFFKGVLMEDSKKILVQQTENVQAGRQLRFTSLEQIEKLEATIKNYIQNAIEVEESGKEVPYKETNQFVVVEEFQKTLDEKPEVAEAFYNLTPGRQRGYLLYFSGAKQSKTRIERVEKSIPYILRGKGLLKGGGFEE
jgi:uncharacterized protein YdeI (YjbR/CyaY-like superfamily)